MKEYRIEHQEFVPEGKYWRHRKTLTQNPEEIKLLLEGISKQAKEEQALDVMVFQRDVSPWKQIAGMKEVLENKG